MQVEESPEYTSVAFEIGGSKMTSPITAEIKDSSFSVLDPNSTTQDDEQLLQLKDNQIPPQSPKITTLEIADESNPVPDDPNHEGLEEIIPVSPTISDFHNLSTYALTFCRRVGGGGKRKRRNAAQEKKSQEKLESLAVTLNLIPFVPVRTLDLSSHESLLRRLGLWDFAQLDFGFKLGRDLILQLIANFNPSGGVSKVNEVRIKVSRADLASALLLPAKKSNVGSGLEVKESEESVRFVLKFVSSFILLHEDTWMMTDNIMNIVNLIKEGNFEKVDFAKLIWRMVKQELSNSELGDCYYASHLQLLIKSQNEDLLKDQEPVKMEIELKEDEQNEELHGVSELEEQNIELSLSGLDNAMKDENDEMDFEEIKEDEDENDEEGEYDEKEEEEHETGFCISPRGFSLEGTDSDILIEAVDFSSGLHAVDFNIQTIPHQSLNKRIRIDEHNDNLKPSPEFDLCMHQMKHVMEKARLTYSPKEREFQNLSTQNQMLVTQMEQQNNIYHHNLAKVKLEEQRRRQMEAYRYEHELRTMEKLLEGYRKALKETTRKFSEYRKKFPLAEEPIYRDSGSGGLVLSKTEIEMRHFIERTIKEFEAGWVAKVEECEIVIEFMGSRLLDVEKGVDFCKGRVARCKESQMKSEEEDV